MPLINVFAITMNLVEIQTIKLYQVKWARCPVLTNPHPCCIVNMIFLSNVKHDLFILRLFGYDRYHDRLWLVGLELIWS